LLQLACGLLPHCKPLVIQRGEQLSEATGIRRTDGTGVNGPSWFVVGNKPRWPRMPLRLRPRVTGLLLTRLPGEALWPPVSPRCQTPP
jgi:hypothetical protein